MIDFRDYLEQHFLIEEVSGGRQLKLSGTCPFCGETRDDLRLYVKGKAPWPGQCHHCGKGFYPAAFVAAHERVSRQDAIKILEGSEDAFVRTYEDDSDGVEIVFPKVIDIEDSEDAQEYLHERNIGYDIIRHFGLQYCSQNTPCPGYGEHETLWTRRRIFVPIYDISGNLICWQARDITGKSHMKYIFPPGFEGRLYLYNAHAIPYGAKYLVLSEGVMDTFGWWRAGAHNVVASFGHKLSSEQVDILLDLQPEEIIIAWDDDSMAQKYALVEKWGHLFNFRIAMMGARDADEQSAAELGRVFKGAKPYSWEDKILLGVA